MREMHESSVLNRLLSVSPPYVHRSRQPLVFIVNTITFLPIIGRSCEHIPCTEALTHGECQSKSTVRASFKLYTCSAIRQCRAAYKVQSTTQCACTEPQGIGSFEHFYIAGGHRIHDTYDIRTIRKVHRNAVLKQINASSLRVTLYA